MERWQFHIPRYVDTFLAVRAPSYVLSALLHTKAIFAVSRRRCAPLYHAIYGVATAAACSRIFMLS